MIVAKGSKLWGEKNGVLSSLLSHVQCQHLLFPFPQENFKESIHHSTVFQELDIYFDIFNSLVFKTGLMVTSKQEENVPKGS